MDVQQVLHMTGGEGETSYANNSLPQRTIMSKTKPLIEEAVADFCSTTMPGILCIADLGCSSGPNSLLGISMFIEAVDKRCRHLGCSSPEFQVSLNDLPRNDFNTIFKTVPSFYNKLREEKGDDFGPCFITGVPGSFYERLFPSNSLHFVYSSNSLHWLSQVPQGFGVEKGTLNKGNIALGKTSPPGVFEAYLEQFQRDFTAFLESRSIEIVPGGRMVLALLGRRIADPFSKDCYHYWDDLAHAFRDMVSEGLVEETEVDSFNMPYYEPHIEELREVIQVEGSFNINRLEEVYRNSNLDDSTGSDMFIGPNVLANCVRAVTESTLTSHFGGAVVDRLFQRFEEIVSEQMRRGTRKNVFLAVSLTRKS